MKAKFEKVTNQQARCNVLNTNHKIHVLSKQIHLTGLLF